MAERQPQNNSDEIDLGQLFQMIGKGFNNLFRAFLGLFVYLKKNAIILIGLIVLGVGIGYGLGKIESQKFKTEVIVKPQMDSKNYLYDVVEEVHANLRNRDSVFFKSIGFAPTNFENLEISISKVKTDESDETDIKYLELLQSFENTEAISDIVRAELQNKSSFNHRITFKYDDINVGKDFAEKVMRYINDNDYFKGLIVVKRTNASSRIEENNKLLEQVDEIISKYAKNMGDSNTSSENNRIVLDNKESVNITGLFSFKNNLIKDVEGKKLELEERTDVIKVINFGKPQPVQKSMFGNKILIIPFLFVLLFLFFSSLGYINKKAKELL